MPINHRIDSGWLLVERTGHISTHDEQGAIEARMKDPKIVTGIPVLVDCRKVEPADSTEVVQYLADHITSHARHLKCGPLAIVVSTDVEYGMANVSNPDRI
jgi:hypothetical protein